MDVDKGDDRLNVNQVQLLTRIATLPSDNPDLCDVHFLVAKKRASDERVRIPANSTLLALRSREFKVCAILIHEADTTVPVGSDHYIHTCCPSVCL